MAVINSLSSENIIKTDNEFVKTGAAISENINDQPLIMDLKDKIKDLFIDLKDKIT